MTTPTSNILDISALFSAHRIELVRHVANIVKCEETAVDIAQESYLILSKSAQGQTIQHPRGFLFRIAINLAINHLRRNKVAESYSHYLVADEINAPSTEHLVNQQERLDFFIQTVEELPPRCRDAFILHKVQGMSMKEVANELKVTVKVVERLIAKGLKHCRDKMLERDDA